MPKPRPTPLQTPPQTPQIEPPPKHNLAYPLPHPTNINLPPQTFTKFRLAQKTSNIPITKITKTKNPTITNIKINKQKTNNDYT